MRKILLKNFNYLLFADFKFTSSEKMAGNILSVDMLTLIITSITSCTFPKVKAETIRHSRYCIR